MLGLGFSSGLPLLLIYGTLSAWLYDAGVSKQVITLLVEMTLAYKLKFLWAPLLERFDPPLLCRWLGRRRAWILVAQVLVAGALCGLAAGDPAHRLAWTIAFGFALGFAGSTQDVVIDGWRIAVAPERKAQMSAWAEIGWRAGTFAGGAGALILADRIGWHGAYFAMAALVVPGVVAALVAPDPPEAAEGGSRQAATLGSVLFDPIKELLGRLGATAVPILLLVAGFRMPGYVAGATATLLFKHLHYSNEDIATVTKFWGVWVALGATFFAGWLVPRIGTGASLLVGTVFGSASHLSLAWLASRSVDGANPGFWPFAVAVGIDGFAYAFASVVLITYMSTLCRSSMAAAQYALLTSLVALPGSLLAAPSGFIIDDVGFARFFVGTSLLGVPVALLALWLWHRGDLTRVAVAA